MTKIIVSGIFVLFGLTAGCAVSSQPTADTESSQAPLVDDTGDPMSEVEFAGDGRQGGCSNAQIRGCLAQCRSYGRNSVSSCYFFPGWDSAQCFC